ncbi:hypothetical protein GN244_ATG19417 [Phytophthora infestans]|uniref:Uncharacterized protein n=1 Tax=Phytophthora infestans TaxID=4787 RepID=A0A833S796_PHYIN|nr:hypothetical protein GN244_ATG19417 [Phytophthora infestans]
MARIWLRLVDRNGERLEEVWVNLSADIIVANLHDALTKSTKLISCDREGAIASDLEVYEWCGDNPLDANVEIGTMGNSLDRALLATKPKVWLRLVDPTGKQVNKGWVN